MKKLKLVGGPADGITIDLDSICNCDNAYCPNHGFNYQHSTNKEKEHVILTETSHYNSDTGEYIEEHY